VDLGAGGACCRLNCLCSRPRYMGEEMKSNIGGKFNHTKKGLAVHKLRCNTCPAAQPGIMRMATLYKPNYDGLCSPCLGGILTVGSLSPTPKPASSRVNYEMRDARYEMPDPPLRSASSLCKSSCTKHPESFSRNDSLPHLIPASLGCWILLNVKDPIVRIIAWGPSVPILLARCYL